MSQRLSGFFWPTVILIGSLAAYFLLFRLFVDPLTPGYQAFQNAQYTFIWEVPNPPPPGQIIASDINARYSVAIPTVLLTLTFIGVLLASFTVLLPRLGRSAIWLGGLGVPVGGVVGYFEQYNNPVRAGVANCPPGEDWTFCPLDQAVLRAKPPSIFDQPSLDLILRLVDLNSALSAAAIVVLGIVFLFIARVRSIEELIPENLRMRRVALNTAIALAALSLVFSVATTHGFYHLASVLMAREDSNAMAALGSAGALYWGAVFSTAFVVIVLPAVVSLYRDVERAARAAMPDATHDARRKWCVEHGLTMDIRDSIAPLLASLAPVLATPALDLVRPALTGA